MKNKDFFSLLVGIISAFALLHFASSCAIKKNLTIQQNKCETIQLKY